jgi:hypothetical protein
MNMYAIAGLTLAATTVALGLLFLFCGLPWVALSAVCAGAMWCQVIAEKEDAAIAAEVDRIELELIEDK